MEEMDKERIIMGLDGGGAYGFDSGGDWRPVYWLVLMLLVFLGVLI